MSVNAIAKMPVKGRVESCIRSLSHQAKYREFTVVELANVGLVRELSALNHQRVTVDDALGDFGSCTLDDVAERLARHLHLFSGFKLAQSFLISQA
ncbi:hypothetical protein VCR31J2_1270373 [Vibrio coralliirubri]|uniref:Uncharacterized protein n=1 Tax=Vibrio coralliirubri TaxID=1516159 RepID=A0AA87BZ07_9VIBR|nr:hypothetical protein VCR31J2_1270373 [Vibrio coralliirubri]